MLLTRQGVSPFRQLSTGDHSPEALAYALRSTGSCNEGRKIIWWLRGIPIASNAATASDVFPLPGAPWIKTVCFGLCVKTVLINAALSLNDGMLISLSVYYSYAGVRPASVLLPLTTPLLTLSWQLSIPVPLR